MIPCHGSMLILDAEETALPVQLSLSRTLSSPPVTIQDHLHQDQILRPMTMEIHALHLIKVNVATTAMIADGHGLMTTQLNGIPRTLTVDARQVLNNSFNE